MKIRLRIPYWYLLLGPTLCYFIGFLMNAFVMVINKNQMPVLFPGWIPYGLEDDIVHAPMTHATHLRFLADWIFVKHVGIASPGDFFEWVYDQTYATCMILWIAFVIKDHTERDDDTKYNRI